MMFRDIMKCVSGVCCAMVMCCGGDVRGMEEERIGFDFNSWIVNGSRFVTEEFIDEFAKTGSIPEIDDKYVDLVSWLSLTSSTYAFSCENGRGEVVEFLQLMLNKYSEHDRIVKSGVIEQLSYAIEMFSGPIF